MRTIDQLSATIRLRGEKPGLYNLVELAQTEAYNEGRSTGYNEGHATGYNKGRYQLDYLAKRNYAATVRRGLITPETRFIDFTDKIYEEVNELYESYDHEAFGRVKFDTIELADIALVCFAMAQHYGIDLIDEMRKKVEFNEKRQD